jgi:hypothetical protein
MLGSFMIGKVFLVYGALYMWKHTGYANSWPAITPVAICTTVWTQSCLWFMWRHMAKDATINRKAHVKQLLGVMPFYLGVLARLTSYSRAFYDTGNWSYDHAIIDVLFEIQKPQDDDFSRERAHGLTANFLENYLAVRQQQSQLYLLMNIFVYPSFWMAFTKLTIRRVNAGQTRCIEKINLILIFGLVCLLLLFQSANTGPIWYAGMLSLGTNCLQALSIPMICLTISTHSHETLSSKLKKRASQKFRIDDMLNEDSVEHQFVRADGKSGENMDDNASESSDEGDAGAALDKGNELQENLGGFAGG